MDAAAALDSSTSAAFCCVIWSRLVTAWFTWPMPSRCSLVDAVISAMRSLTRRTPWTISSMLWPAWLTCCEPDSTLSTLAVIRPLISLAASALRWASARTSPATTAKPRPCSPARAASTAAFSARMLVWKAMESITPMMSAILWLESVMCCMLATTWPTTSPPRCAAWAAWPASRLAWRAVSADCVTVAVSSSMLAAVSSRLAAVCSVRADRSWLPVAIWLDAADTDSTPERTSPTTARRRAAMAESERSRWPSSSLRSSWMSAVRSPPAIWSARPTARSSGTVTLRTVSQASTRPMARISIDTPMPVHCATVRT